MEAEPEGEFRQRTGLISQQALESLGTAEHFLFPLPAK